MKTCSVVNVVESSIARDSELVLPIHCGPEVGVASTKAFLGQMLVLYMLCLKLSYDQKFISGDPVKTFIELAGEDHIIVMGASTRSAFAKFFLGSKPIKTLQKANCPILIVKGE